MLNLKIETNRKINNKYFNDSDSFTLKNDQDTNKFLIRVSGDSMFEAGIHDGDTLLVKKDIIPKSGDIVIAEINNCLAVKRLQHANSKTFLISDNKNYSPIEISENDDFKIWGVVSMVIKSV